MKKRLRVLLGATLAAVVLLHTSAFANEAATESYTATIKYYDEIQVTYNLYYPSGTSWSGPEDVPIGGAGGFFSQLYCVDPFVAFHKVADSIWDGTTTDTMGGYVVAAPWAISGALQQNAEAVYWLLMNGYRGDFLANDAESRESVARLNYLYSDLPALRYASGAEGGDESDQDGFLPTASEIDRTVALMATKVAIWKVLAGDDVQVLSTSLDPAREEIFSALTDAMILDAFNLRPTGLEATKLTLSIDDSRAVDGELYGPLYVNAEVINSYGYVPDLEKIYLTVSGPSSGGIVFTDAEGNELPEGRLYGTDQDAQYLAGDAFDGSDFTSGPFYMKIPTAREVRFGDMLTVNAMARVPSVSLSPGTPVTLIYGGGGTQDWDYVQALAGAAADGMRADLYAEASIYTGETALGELYVQKKIENALPSDDETEFAFAVFMSPDENFANARRLDFNDYPVRAAAGVVTNSDAGHYFTLRNGGLAMINGLPLDYYYWIREINLDEGFFKPPRVAATIGTLSGAGGVANEAGPLKMDDGLAAAMVVFENIKQLPKAHLQIGKEAIGFDDENLAFTSVLDEAFYFAIEQREPGDEIWEPVELSMPGNFSVNKEIGIAGGATGTLGGGGLVEDEPGQFYLYSGGRAYVELNPEYEYRVMEFAAEGYATAYGMLYYAPDEATGEFRWFTMNSYLPPAYWRDENKSKEGDPPLSTDAFAVDPDGHYSLQFMNAGVPSFDLTLRKTEEGGEGGKDFAFQLITSQGEILPFTTKTDVYGAMRVEGSGFRLADQAAPYQVSPDEFEDELYITLLLESGGEATIKNLPAGRYYLRELYEDGYGVSVFVNGVEIRSGSDGYGYVITEMIPFASETSVEFVNTKIPDGENPYEPRTPSDPDEPETPDEPDTPTTPDTPDRPRTPREGPTEPRNPGAEIKPSDEDEDVYIEVINDGDTVLGRWVLDANDDWVFTEQIAFYETNPYTGERGSFALLMAAMAITAGAAVLFFILNRRMKKI